MHQAAHNAPYADKLKAAEGAKDEFLTPAGYYASLQPLCSRFDIWLSV